jgi:hypothetical protein
MGSMQLRLREIAKLIAGCLSFAGFAVMVFWLSGTFRWQRAWGCIGIMVVLHAMSCLGIWNTPSVSATDSCPASGEV